MGFLKQFINITCLVCTFGWRLLPLNRRRGHMAIWDTEFHPVASCRCETKFYRSVSMTYKQEDHSRTSTPWKYSLSLTQCKTFTDEGGKNGIFGCQDSKVCVSQIFKSLSVAFIFTCWWQSHTCKSESRA